MRPLDSFVINSRQLLGSVVQAVQVDKAIVADDPHLPKPWLGRQVCRWTVRTMDENGICRDFGKDDPG